MRHRNKNGANNNPVISDREWPESSTRGGTRHLGLPRTEQRHKQRGVALVLAVFIITVLAALGAYIVSVNAVQHQTVALSLQQARALNAARSGIQWDTYQILQLSGCPTVTSFTPGTPSLSAFTVRVECTASKHKINNRTVHIYVIDATATAGTYGATDYVLRHVRSTIQKVTL